MSGDRFDFRKARAGPQWQEHALVCHDGFECCFVARALDNGAEVVALGTHIVWPVVARRERVPAAARFQADGRDPELLPDGVATVPKIAPVAVVAHFSSTCYLLLPLMNQLVEEDVVDVTVAAFLRGVGNHPRVRPPYKGRPYADLRKTAKCRHRAAIAISARAGRRREEDVRHGQHAIEERFVPLVKARIQAA